MAKSTAPKTGALTGSGPVIAALPETLQSRSAIESYDLQRLRPRVHKYDQSVTRVLPTVKSIPGPETASPTAPEVVALLYETPGVEPTLRFEHFIRGVAVVAGIVPDEFHSLIKEGLLAVAERVIGGGELPAIDVCYAPNLLDAEERIFSNGEPMSWGPLMAFTQGAYWLLGFISSPGKKRGQRSAEAYVAAVITRAAELAHGPQ